MDVLHLSITLVLLLFAVAVLAGFIDTLAGGGGLITLPFLFLVGLPPLHALGTNKLQGVAGTLMASAIMLRKKQISWPQMRGAMLTTGIAAMLGTFTVQFIDTHALNVIIPIILLLMGGYFLWAPNLDSRGQPAKISAQTYQNTAAPVIGFYDGMFGPGTGTFFSLSGIVLRGQSLVQATASAKALNLASNVGAITIFMLAGKVFWAVGGIMVIGQFVGAWIGSHSLLRVSSKVLRPLIVIMCLLMLLRYSWQMGWFAWAI